MRFEWDPSKASANLKKHQVSFDEAKSVFFDDFAVQFFDDEHSSNEERFIMLGMSSLALVEGQVEALRQLGYQYMPEHEIEMPQRRFFAKPTVRPRQFHLHAVIVGQTFWNEHLLFRDALRTDGRLAQAYALLKYSLAAQYKDDREGYTSAKASFIVSLIPER